MTSYWKWLMAKPLLEDSFLKNGQLSTEQFKKSGNHLQSVCEGWKWRPSSNPKYTCEYLDKDKQFLIYQRALCKKRIGTIKEQQGEIFKDQDGQEIYVLKKNENQKQEELKEEDVRYYNMYIVYDEYYHCPRMSFMAFDHEMKQISNEAIRDDIQKQYLDQTLTVEEFPFMENVQMATVHPCKHSNVLKTMSDSMIESGQDIKSHFALLIFMKFIASVIPHVEFDTVGDLQFK